RRELRRELDHLHARFHPDRLRPTAEQSLRRAVGDAVDLALGAFRRLSRDEAVVAGVAGLVDVEKGDDVAFLHGVAPDVEHSAGRLLDDADRDVARDDRKGNAETPVMEVYVGSADLRVERAEKRGTWCEHRRV